MKWIVFSLVALIFLNGCTVAEFNKGVDEGITDVKRVIRGNNN